MNQEEGNSSIKIKSIQADSLYRVNNGYENAFLDLGDAIINNSIFSEFVRRHGVTVNRKNASLDLITLKFDYGVSERQTNGQRKQVMTARELREYYYENGARVVWNTYDKEGAKIIESKTVDYKMLMRSPGKAKEGHCIFIRSTLHEKVFRYITMGLYDRMPFHNAKIVELSAYDTLITATALDYVKLPIDGIFVAKDEDVSVSKKAVTVKAMEMPHLSYKLDKKATEGFINKYNLTFYRKKQKENPSMTLISSTKRALMEHGIQIEQCPKKEIVTQKKECFVETGEEPCEIKNTLWDGMGLIDDSVFPSNMEGFIYCRSHFFKSCLFRGNLQEYFKDYYGDGYEDAVVTDMFGRKMKASEIKVIITENSLKWMKFIDLMGGTPSSAFRYYKKFMKKNGERFAIVKTAHKSKWGDLQRSSYQINGSLPTTDEDVLASIAKESIDYCNELKLNHEAFIRHLAVTGSAKYSINNVLIALDQWNENFKYTQYFKDKKTDMISRFKKERLQLGKLLQNGDNLTICGNPIALLMKVTGQDFMREPCFQQKEDCIQCYTDRFKNGEALAGFRSPHNSPNNIVYLVNTYSAEIRKYFPDLGGNVIIINGIGTDVQSRLNGQDLDTDSIYATNQKEMVELARKAYVEYPTIVNDIKTVGNSSYDKSMKCYAEMDNDISAAQYAIGYSSNIAQLALSYYYDEGCQSKDLEQVFIICSVLAQVAIDSAKRNFEIKAPHELARIRKLSCMNRKPKYPRFYADVQKLKQKRSKRKGMHINESDIGDFNCPMDILYRIIEERVVDLRKEKSLNTKTVNFRSVFEYKSEGVRADRKQYQKVLSIVREYDEKVKGLDGTREDYHEACSHEFHTCMSKLGNLRIKEDTMYTLVAYAFQDKNRKIRDKLLTVLYDKDKNGFLKSFKKTEESPHEIPETLDFTGFSISDYEGGRERIVS